MNYSGRGGLNVKTSVWGGNRESYKKSVSTRGSAFRKGLAGAIREVRGQIRDQKLAGTGTIAKTGILTHSKMVKEFPHFGKALRAMEADNGMTAGTSIVRLSPAQVGSLKKADSFLAKHGNKRLRDLVPPALRSSVQRSIERVTDFGGWGERVGSYIASDSTVGRVLSKAVGSKYPGLSDFNKMSEDLFDGKLSKIYQ